MAGALEHRELTVSLEQFVEQTSRLLSIERKEEIDEAKRVVTRSTPKEQEKQGVCVNRLNASTIHTGLYGRILVVFESSRRTKDRTLAANKLSSGDIVSVHDTTGREVASGVVTTKRQTAIIVAFEETPGSLQGERQYRLVRQSNDVTYRRLKT